MLVGCRQHARAFCRISIAELRRVAPPAFSVLMVISLLLADGLFPVFASKYRSQASLYISNNVARSRSGGGDSGSGGGGGSNIDSVLYSRSSNNRYRTKVRVKPMLTKRGESVANGASPKFLRSHLHLKLNVQHEEASQERSDRKTAANENTNRASSGENNLIDYEEFPPQMDEARAPSDVLHLSSSLSSSSSSASSASSSLTLSSSSHLVSASNIIQNSSKNVVSPSLIISAMNHTNLDNNTCASIEQINNSPPHLVCRSLASRNQCLVFTTDLLNIYGNCTSEEDKISIIENSRLQFCSSYRLANVISVASLVSGCQANETVSNCSANLQRIIDIDKEVDDMYRGFAKLIGRYDCNSIYSVKWQCHHCKRAYKDWLCSQKLTFFWSGQDVPPCMEFCSHVEEMCPFFRPILESYAGDHSFICKDPHTNLPSTIPETNCYRLCDLWSESQISDFYCSHANFNKANCPLLQYCDKVIRLETTSTSIDSNISNNTTSGSDAMSTVLRTPTFCLFIFCMVLASVRLPLTVNDLQSIPIGLT